MRPPRRRPKRVSSDSARRCAADDLLFVLLIGHGSFDGADAKFNLVGPDLSSRGMGRPAQPHARARSSLVNTTAASFPFLEHARRPRAAS